MIVNGSSGDLTIINYHAPLDLGFMRITQLYVLGTLENVWAWYFGFSLGGDRYS